jgi:ribosomal protein S18 acetylase RimI-like enzyme
MTPASFTVRRLAEEDAASFREIRLAAVTQSPEAFGTTLELAASRPLSWYADRLTESAIFAAFLDGRVVGIVGLRHEDGPKERHKATLWSMFVRAEARGHGIGAALVQAALEHAGRLGEGDSRVEQVVLFVVADNLPAIRLYERFGFTAWGREPRAHKSHGVYADELHMIRFLAP